MITLEQVIYVLPLLGLAASLFYYALVLRNQNTTRQAQMFYGIYNRTSQADFVEAWNAFTSWEYANLDEAMKIREDAPNSHYGMTLSVYFDGLGVLVRLGLVPIQYIANFLQVFIRHYWIVREGRERFNDPRRHVEVEHLYTELMKYLEEHPELKT
jgi:hypothetical protein